MFEDCFVNNDINIILPNTLFTNLLKSEVRIRWPTQSKRL